MKKLISVLLCVVTLLSVCSIFAFAADTKATADTEDNATLSLSEALEAERAALETKLPKIYTSDEYSFPIKVMFVFPTVVLVSYIKRAFIIMEYMVPGLSDIAAAQVAA